MSNAGFILMLTVMKISAFCQTDIPPGNVGGTWTFAGSPYHVNGEITVPNGETLTIEPGVDVVFTGHYKLIIQGRLLAVGTKEDTIAFTAQDPKSGWHGMRFINTPGTNDSSKIIYCSLKHGKANTGNDLDRCGGGMAVKNFNKLLISDCLIDSNMQSGSIATTGGGAISLWTASPIINSCEFNANTGIYGAAMAVYYSSNPLIRNNHFHDNTGHGTINIGGGSIPVLINNLVENNTSTAPAHGILHFEGGSGRAVFINNTIVNNNCGGSAIWENDGSTPLFINNIILGNKPAQVRLEVPSGPGFFHCLIEGGKAGFTGAAFSGVYEDCIDLKPGFAGTADFHLADDSPCIGAGADSVQISGKWHHAPAYDFEGKRRPDPFDSHPDIGAFENVLGAPTTGIKETIKPSPDGFLLYQNYPNPFNPNTTVRFDLPEATRIRLSIFDLTGREITVLFNGMAEAGGHEVCWEGRGIQEIPLPSGVYLCKLETTAFQYTRRMLLLR